MLKKTFGLDKLPEQHAHVIGSELVTITAYCRHYRYRRFHTFISAKSER